MPCITVASFAIIRFPGVFTAMFTFSFINVQLHEQLSTLTFSLQSASPRLVLQSSPCSQHQHMVLLFFQPDLQKLSILSLRSITGVFTLDVYGATV